MERRMAKQMTDVHRTVAAGRFRDYMAGACEKCKNSALTSGQASATSATTASAAAVWRLDPASAIALPPCCGPMPCVGTSSCGKLTGRYHGCAASRNGIHWTPSKCCRTRTGTPWTLWCCRTGWTSWKTIAAAWNLLPANPLRARPSLAVACNASSPPAPQGHYAILYTCNARPWTWQCAFGGPRPLPGVWRFRRTAA